MKYKQGSTHGCGSGIANVENKGCQVNLIINMMSLIYDYMYLKKSQCIVLLVSVQKLETCHQMYFKDFTKDHSDIIYLKQHKIKIM